MRCGKNEYKGFLFGRCCCVVFSAKTLYYMVASFRSVLPWQPTNIIMNECANMRAPEVCNMSRNCVYQVAEPLCVPSTAKMVREHGKLEPETFFLSVKKVVCVAIGVLLFSLRNVGENG